MGAATILHLTDDPSAWSNQDAVLFHGSDLKSVEAMVTSGIDLRFSRTNLDFGVGFYATSVAMQAQEWARDRIRDDPSRGTAAVMRITVPREDLAKLDTLAFVLGGRDPFDFWSFVWHCRNGAVNHGRPASVGSASYDLVVGPVAAFWRQKLLIAHADQFGFHTPASISLLNRCRRETLPL